ncbi:OprO/OprP family phosphate-selective porin [Paludisphaera mucosa]|uniref:Porin n=1 Tax=Paludisphaera mucosa TaxID=3030827 RepID=A0ABT6FIM4_9BACT|nr:porin [Paludisphaera mucosa]MDG3007432.1 porin [Paludisphaera mucosa]
MCTYVFKRPGLAVLLGFGVVLGGSRGMAQEAAAPPLPAVDPTPGPEDVSTAERLRRMEAINQHLIQKLEELSRKNDELSGKVDEMARGAAGSTSAGEAEGGKDGGGTGTDDGSFPSAAGGGSKASGGDPTDTGTAQEVGSPAVATMPLRSYYDFAHDGFKWTTHDDEFTFGIRGMTQVDARIYQQPNQNPVSSGLYNPRSRIYFFGNFTRPIQYEFSFQNTFDSVGLLDAYLNFNYDSRFQVRVGRYKTPFSYEWYRIHVWHLLAPERSLFANNYEGNRRFGLMGTGDLFERRIEYAVGTFNTQRNSFKPYDNRQDVMAFMNFKPFYNREEGFLLRDLQFGGSVDAGRENQPLSPAALRLSAPPATSGITGDTAANSANVPWMVFNDNVRERGRRALWELHAAYYLGGLTLMGAWQGGRESYSTKTSGPFTTVPISGWFAQAGYILTGETIRDRTLIQPLHPFDLRKGKFGLGAFEVTGRYSTLALGEQVFTAGLVDRNNWTNHTQMTDLGFNWYMNKFVKVYFDWEHAMFAQPVLYNVQQGLRQSTSDLFWMRFQVYF